MQVPWVQFAPNRGVYRENAQSSCYQRIRGPKSDLGMWKSLVTSYPPGWIEMFESEAARGDGFAVGPEGKMIAAVAVGKWESRGFGGISKRSGKPVLGFPRSGFSTAVSAASALRLQCAAYVGPLLRSDS